MKSIEAKIVVLGSQGVGKTSVVVRYVSNMFNKHVSPTIGASFFTCKMVMDNYRVKLQVWDTAGQERFRSMAPMYYRKSNAAMLVFDLTSAESFDEMRVWMLELKKNVDEKIVTCVLGNKSDLKSSREITEETALDYASSIGAAYFETSALSSEGIQDAFVHLAQELILKTESAIENSSIEQSSSQNAFPVTSNDIDTNFPGNLNSQNKPEESERKGVCC